MGILGINYLFPGNFSKKEKNERKEKRKTIFQERKEFQKRNKERNKEPFYDGCKQNV